MLLMTRRKRAQDQEGRIWGLGTYPRREYWSRSLAELICWPADQADSQNQHGQTWLKNECFLFFAERKQKQRQQFFKVLLKQDIGTLEINIIYQKKIKDFLIIIPPPRYNRLSLWETCVQTLKTHISYYLPMMRVQHYLWHKNIWFSKTGKYCWMKKTLQATRGGKAYYRQVKHKTRTKRRQNSTSKAPKKKWQPRVLYPMKTSLTGEGKWRQLHLLNVQMTFMKWPGQKCYTTRNAKSSPRERKMTTGGNSDLQKGWRLSER